MLISVLALFFYLVRLFCFALRRTRCPYRRLGEPNATGYPSRPKPTWVREEIIRLKALMREAGTCRAIADSFNRRFAAKRKMTAGRTWVNETIRKHRYEIEIVACLKGSLLDFAPRLVVQDQELTPFP